MFLLISDKMDKTSKNVPWRATLVQRSGFSFAVEENTLKLRSHFAIFEPQIWRNLGRSRLLFFRN